MQVVTNTCCAWAKANCLNWNPLKSQLLRMITQVTEKQGHPTRHEQNNVPAHSVVLDNVSVTCSDGADYLGLRINKRRGLICKDMSDMKAKGTAAVFNLTTQKWFSLCLNPKFLINLYDTSTLHVCAYCISLWQLTVVNGRETAIDSRGWHPGDDLPKGTTEVEINCTIGQI